MCKSRNQALKSTTTNWTLVTERLNSVFVATNHSDEKQQLACAKAFGTCATSHLALVLDKLELLLKAGAQKKTSSFFGLLKDIGRISEDQLQTRCTILYCVGQAAARAGKADLKAKVDEVTAKFLMPELKGVNSVLKLAALRAMTDLAAALHDEAMWSDADKGPRLAHHGDLMHEAIACLKVRSRSLHPSGYSAKPSQPFPLLL